jgi:RNA polymerase sigma-70 factor (ECF subfamily)
VVNRAAFNSRLKRKLARSYRGYDQLLPSWDQISVGANAVLQAITTLDAKSQNKPVMSAAADVTSSLEQRSTRYQALMETVSAASANMSADRWPATIMRTSRAMAAKFETTNWSIIVRANASATEVRRVALGELCHAYWYPLYLFARRRGDSHEDASDLTQAFFVHLIEKHALGGVTPSGGRFRAFLLASFKNFQSDARDQAHTLKRGGDWIRIPWNAELLETRYGAAARAGEDPEQLFDRQWALTVIDRARERLRTQYVEADRVHDFDVLWPYLAPERGETSAAGLAQALGTNAGAARVAVYRFRRRFGSALRAEVASTVEDPEQVESELRFLLAVLAGRGDNGAR